MSREEFRRRHGAARGLFFQKLPEKTGFRGFSLGRNRPLCSTMFREVADVRDGGGSRSRRDFEEFGLGEIRFLLRFRHEKNCRGDDPCQIFLSPGDAPRDGKSMNLTSGNINEYQGTLSRFLSHLACFQVSILRKSLVVKGNGWGGNRTPDTRIFSPLLCQLSYPAVIFPSLRRLGKSQP